MSSQNKKEKAMKMIISAAMLLFALSLPSSGVCADAAMLSSNTGNLLRGTVYKQSGVERSGVITVRTDWRLPSEAPVYRYDFDVIRGTMEGNLYSFLLADVQEIEFLPLDENRQPVNIRLRNGVIQKLMLSSESVGVFGKMNLGLKEVDVMTDGYGDNIIMGGDVQKIVFSPPPAPGEEDMNALISSFGKALAVGKRDGLLDKDYSLVLDNIYAKMKAKLGELNKNK